MGKPESKAAAARRIKAAKRANAALRPTHHPESDLAPPPDRKGLGWGASWWYHGGSLAGDLHRRVGRVFNGIGACFELPRVAPGWDSLPPRPSGSQGAKPLHETRLAALLWLRGKAEREFGSVLADLDDQIQAEIAEPTEDGWTEELAERFTGWRR